MPKLVWKQVGFLDYVDVEPSVQDEIMSHSYEIRT